MSYKKSLPALLIVFFNFAVSFPQSDTASLPLSNGEKIVNGLCFSKGGSMIAYTDGKTIQVRNLIYNTLHCLLANGHTEKIISLDYSADSSMIISGGADSLSILWDAKSGQILRKLNYHKGKVTAVRFSPDGRLIYSGSTDKKLICYSIERDSVLFTSKVHTSDILAIDLNPDGKLIASCGAERTVYIIDASSGAVINRIDKCMKWVRCSKFNSTGNLLATCCDNGSIYFWNISNPFDIKFERKEHLSGGWITSMDFFPGTDYYTYSAENGKIGVMVMGNNSVIKTRKPALMVKIRPHQGYQVRLGVATYGDGLLITGTK